MMKEEGKHFSRPEQRSPLDNIPFDRNPWFYGRKTLLAEVSNRLGRYETKDLKTCVLCGTAGIGKTQLALHYALSRKELALSHGEAAERVILWVKCETNLQIAQSLRTIANMLGLAEAQDDIEMEKCRMFFFGWLSSASQFLGNFQVN